VLILLLQAMTAVQTTLLMRSGDVEMNPGPGVCMVDDEYTCRSIMLFSLFLTRNFSDLDYDAVDSTTILSEHMINSAWK
jgi:hypothetical protein